MIFDDRPEGAEFRLLHTRKEEIANGISHGLGTALSAVGLILMILRTLPLQDRLRLASVVIFGTSMILAHLASTLYHIIPEKKYKKILQFVDHGSIYFLVAGTFTPLLLVTLKPALGWIMFALVWAFAFGGIVFKIFFINRYPRFEASTYIIMGSLSTLIMKQLYLGLPFVGFLWVLLGSLIYLLGLIFLGWHSLPYNHTIWHLFVMGGSVSHFYAIYFYVLPAG
ncbi:hemolysin III family protein [Candidatus Bipolaricaulota bacterium]|nr:hemolysin III family protein [Candidatus Bipolaricaulota bacterium]